MENASKALIIAGAILLSILIIALGIYVFNMAKGSFNGNQLSEVEKSTFNQQFTKYEGQQAGSTVKALIDEIIANASENKEAQDRLPKIVYVKGSGTAASNNYDFTVNKSNNVNESISGINDLRTKVADRHIYTITYNMDTTGLVNQVTINY